MSLAVVVGAQPARSRDTTQVKVAKIESSQLPSIVTSKFESTFTGATGIRWEKHELKNSPAIHYIAVFTEGGVRSRARYKEDGTILSSSKYFGPQKLPTNIKAAASRNHPDFVIVGGQEITIKNGKTFYRVRSRKGPSKLLQYFDADGNEVTRDTAPEGLIEVDEDGNE